MTRTSLLAGAGLFGAAAGVTAAISRRRREARRTLCPDLDLHRRKVERIARQLRERPDGRPGSLRTLGILSQLTFRLMPAQPFVKLQYEHYQRLDEYLDAIRGHFQRQDADFMDGIIHSPTHYVLSIGRFAAAAPYTHRYDWLR